MSKIMKTTKITKKTWKDIGFVAALVSIPILQFLIFYVFINGNVILLAFQKENNAFTFDNFHFLFRYFGSSNSTLLEALVNTLKFFALQIVMFPVSLLFSYFLYKKIFLQRPCARESNCVFCIFFIARFRQKVAVYLVKA